MTESSLGCAMTISNYRYLVNQRAFPSDPGARQQYDNQGGYIIMSWRAYAVVFKGPIDGWECFTMGGLQVTNMLITGTF